MSERQIKYIPLTDVRPADVNPKAHDIGSIATSILRRGFVEVPALDGRTGKLVAGHGRIEALQWLHKEGREPPEGIKTRGDEWLVPVLHGWSSKSDADAMAYLVASNRLVEAGGWDETELERLLVEIGRAGELDGTGYDDDDVDKILRAAAGDETPAEPPPATSWVKPGDLFALGEHRLLCGDSTKAEDVARLMGGERAALMHTDPPYGMCLDTDFDAMIRDNKHGAKTWNAVRGDGADFDPRLIVTLFKNFECPEMFIWGADYFSELLEDRKNGSWLVWDKRLDEAMDSLPGNTFELCWSKVKHKRRVIRHLWSGHHGLTGADAGPRLHPTQKPVAVVEFILSEWAPSQCLVVDPYLGSGPSLIAAERTGRRCFGIELEPRFCQVAIERWERETGLTHVKLERT